MTYSTFAYRNLTETNTLRKSEHLNIVNLIHLFQWSIFGLLILFYHFCYIYFDQNHSPVAFAYSTYRCLLFNLICKVLIIKSIRLIRFTFYQIKSSFKLQIKYIICIFINTQENHTFLNEATTECELISFSHAMFKKLIVNSISWS